MQELKAQIAARINYCRREPKLHANNICLQKVSHRTIVIIKLLLLNDKVGYVTVSINYTILLTKKVGLLS